MTMYQMYTCPVSMLEAEIAGLRAAYYTLSDTGKRQLADMSMALYDRTGKRPASLSEATKPFGAEVDTRQGG